jgi:hypothetical protein
MAQLQKCLVHPVWGLPLDVYLSISKDRPLRLPPAPDKVNQSLTLLGTGKATIEALEICLSLVNNQHELRVIMREDLLSGCMIALRQYCAENRVSL